MIKSILLTFVLISVASAQEPLIKRVENKPGKTKLKLIPTEAISPTDVTREKLYYAGALIGLSSQTNVTDSDRVSTATYGLEALGFLGDFGGALRLSQFGNRESSSGSIKVGSVSRALKVSGLYRLRTFSFDPYGSVGGGVIARTVETSIQDDKSSATGYGGYYDLGLGALVPVGSHFGVNFSVSYYNQLSGLSGFTYLVSFGIENLL